LLPHSPWRSLALFLLGWVMLLPRAQAGVVLEELRWDVQIAGPYAEITVEQRYQNDGEDPIKPRFSPRSDVAGPVAEPVIHLEGRAEPLPPGTSIPPGAGFTTRSVFVETIPRIDHRYTLVLSRTELPTLVSPESPAPERVRSAVTVKAQTGLPTRDLSSPTHPHTTTFLTQTGFLASASFTMQDEFQLRWAVATGQPQATVLHDDSHAMLFVESGIAPPIRRSRRSVTLHVLLARPFETDPWDRRASASRFRDLARLGGGIFLHPRPGESPTAFTQRFRNTLSEPPITELHATWGAFGALDPVPATIPTAMLVRFDGTPGPVDLNARLHGQRWKLEALPHTVFSPGLLSRLHHRLLQIPEWPSPEEQKKAEGMIHGGVWIGPDPYWEPPAPRFAQLDSFQHIRPPPPRVLYRHLKTQLTLHGGQAQPRAPFGPQGSRSAGVVAQISGGITHDSLNFRSQVQASTVTREPVTDNVQRDRDHLAQAADLILRPHAGLREVRLSLSQTRDRIAPPNGEPWGRQTRHLLATLSKPRPSLATRTTGRMVSELRTTTLRSGSATDDLLHFSTTGALRTTLEQHQLQVELTAESLRRTRTGETLPDPAMPIDLQTAGPDLLDGSATRDRLQLSVEEQWEPDTDLSALFGVQGAASRVRSQAPTRKSLFAGPYAALRWYPGITHDWDLALAAGRTPTPLLAGLLLGDNPTRDAVSMALSFRLPLETTLVSKLERSRLRLPGTDRREVVWDTRWTRESTVPPA